MTFEYQQFRKGSNKRSSKFLYCQQFCIRRSSWQTLLLLKISQISLQMLHLAAVATICS